uniref:2-(3-amino-3-carboxypropyl)histidine synthase subunit 1 n=1 Tax=Globodera rostochiensis TaxID=31243 RepID=A0A914GY11_GLORO
MRPSLATNQRQEIEELAQNSALLEDLAILPRNYSFEIPKTIWKIKSTDAKIVALQFPEGLTMYACVIVDILEKYTGAEFIILGDVTYGACCVDDFTACLVPIQDTVGIHLLYVFVNIDMGTAHFLDTIRRRFGAEDDEQRRRRPQTLALVSTIQFVAILQVFVACFFVCGQTQIGGKDGFNIVIPQSNPLSPGELLGCTAPVLPKDVTAIPAMYVALDRAKTAVPPGGPEPALIEYPMDFYAYDSGGPWTNNHQMHRRSTASQPRRRREHISLK